MQKKIANHYLATADQAGATFYSISAFSTMCIHLLQGLGESNFDLIIPNCDHTNTVEKILDTS